MPEPEVQNSPEEAGVDVKQEQTQQQTQQQTQKIPVQNEEQTSKKQEGDESQQTSAEDKEKQSLQAQKEHFREKAEKAEQKTQELEQKLSQAGSSQSMPSNTVDVAKMANKLKDYSSEEVDFIIRNAQTQNPDDVMKAADDEWVQGAIQSRRQKVEQEGNTPAPSSPSSSSSKEPTPEEVGKMTRDEHKRYEEEFQRKQRGGSGL